jgi:hypothetical protein
MQGCRHSELKRQPQTPPPSRTSRSRTWQRLKLLRSYGDYLGITALRALREMYVRAGGQTLLDDDVARAAAREDEDSPAARLLGALGSDEP